MTDLASVLLFSTPNIMSSSIIQSLLAPDPSLRSAHEHTIERYREGLFGSYLQRGDTSLATAEALARHLADPGMPEALRAELLRASELFFKALRVSLGVSATRARELPALLSSGGAVRAPMPDCAVRHVLENIVRYAEATTLSPELAALWARDLRALAAEAHRLPRFPPSKARRASPRPRARLAG